MTRTAKVLFVILALILLSTAWWVETRFRIRVFPQGHPPFFIVQDRQGGRVRVAACASRDPEVWKELRYVCGLSNIRPIGYPITSRPRTRP